MIGKDKEKFPSKFRREGNRAGSSFRVYLSPRPRKKLKSPTRSSVAAWAREMREGSPFTGHLPPHPRDARALEGHQPKARPLPVSLYPRVGLPRRAAEGERTPQACALAPRVAWRWGFSSQPAVPRLLGRRVPGASPPAPTGPQSAGLRSPARRRYGDSDETPAVPAPANRRARRGETRTSLFQDGGASVASSRAEGKPAKSSKAAARERTEGAAAAVGGGSSSFRCCYGCCHAARLGRSSLPRGVIMLTEVSGSGGQYYL